MVFLKPFIPLMNGIFGNTTLPAVDTYEFPSSANSWGGFANTDASIYPLTFSDPNLTYKITFQASSQSDVHIKFKFEKNPYPNVKPDFETANVKISGNTLTNYEVTFSSQANNTFSSFLLYIVERDIPVVIKNIQVHADEDLTWNSRILGSGHYNNEVQEYVSYPNLATANNNFTINLKRTANGYTSHRINMTDEIDALKIIPGNQIEISFEAKLPSNLNAPLWPAVWMLGTEYSGWGGSVNWPEVGEIDLLEWKPSYTTSSILTTAHGNPSSAPTVFTTVNNDLSSDFYRYSYEIVFRGQNSVTSGHINIKLSDLNGNVLATSKVGSLPASLLNKSSTNTSASASKYLGLIINLAMGSANTPFFGGDSTDIKMPNGNNPNIGDTVGTFQVKNLKIQNVSSAPIVGLPTVVPSEPNVAQQNIASVFSDNYQNIASNYNPNWGQSGSVSVLNINGTEILYYNNFNYQGTDINNLAGTDFSNMDNLHVDVYVPTNTSRMVKVSPVNNGTGVTEFLVEVPLIPGSWNRVTIPKSSFVGMTWDSVIQLKFDGQFNADGSANTTTPFDIYFDNIYFSKSVVANSFGDPHVSTFNNKLYELSHDVKTYRMLQGKDIIINASTRNLNNEEKEEIKKLSKELKVPLILDGVVYEKLFIKCGKYIAIYDFQTRKFKFNLHNFFRADGPWLIINTLGHGKIKVKITSGNAMNKYNFSVKVTSLDGLTGLLEDEYLLKSMEVESLEDTKKIIGVKGKNPVLSKLIKIKK